MSKSFLCAVALAFAAGCAPEARPLPETRTFETMLAAGHYHNVSDGITEQNFVVDASRYAVENLRLLQSEGALNTEQIRAFLASQQAVPATIEQLQAYTVAFPESMRGGAIVALGSPLVDDSGRVQYPAAYEEAGGRRSLYLAYDNGNEPWHFFFKFLVRAPQPAAGM